MNIIKKPLENGQYLTQEFEKDSIFLHHTIGLSAESAWRWWNQTPARVGTPYIIDRDGSIIECFDPKMWAFHLGVSNDDNYHEKHSVNIELVSAGPLRKVNDEFRFYPLWPNQSRYTVIPEEEVITFKKEYKGFKYYHGYTEAQLKSLQWLIGKICLEFPKVKIDNPVNDMFKFDEEILTKHKAGMYAHSAVREDKSDIIPYKEIIDVLTATQEEIAELRKPTKIEEAKVTSAKPKKSSKSSKN